MEPANFHGGHDHLEGFFAGGPDSGTEQFDVFEHFDERLVETKVPHGASNPPIFNKKQAIAGHTGHYLFVGVDFADVPEASDEQAAFGGGDHFFYGRISAAENKIHGRFAVLIRKRKSVAGRLLARRIGG